MYKLHLIFKYLRKRRIAWVSLLAVTLCTAMVIVVLSVMGGWLRMFRASFHGLTGDVIVESRSLTGFPFYQQMLGDIEKLPEVEAAAPVIRTFGLINIRNVIRDGVQVIGFPIDQIVKVNDFGASLNRKKNHPSFSLYDDVPYELIPPANKDARKRPGMIVGAGVVGIRKDGEGKLEVPPGLYEAWASLTLLGISGEGSGLDVGDKEVTPYWIVDYSRTQVWQYDSKTVYVPFAQVQKDLHMDAFGEEPARTHDIQIKVKPGIDPAAAKIKIKAIVDRIVTEHDISFKYPIAVETWEESQAMWLGAIENEKSLMTFLFGLISIVAIFMIFCIFYMIVQEKTKDIGIVKSVGATNAGVAGIFLGYGFAIGLVGGGMGLGVGYLIVRYINELHTWMGRALGIVIWKPEVYAFDTIPNTINRTEVLVIVAVAVVSSVVGALVPATRAARMNPIEALRWE